MLAHYLRQRISLIALSIYVLHHLHTLLPSLSIVAANDSSPATAVRTSAADVHLWSTLLIASSAASMIACVLSAPSTPLAWIRYAVAWIIGLPMSVLALVLFGLPLSALSSLLFFTTALSAAPIASASVSAELAFAALLSSLVFAPIVSQAGWSIDRWYARCLHWRFSSLSTGESSKSDASRSSSNDSRASHALTPLPSLFAVVFAIASSFLLALDWGTVWQVFPFPLIAGAAVGFVIGAIAEAVLLAVHRSGREKKQ